MKIRDMLYEYVDKEFRDKIYDITDPTKTDFSSFTDEQKKQLKSMMKGDKYITNRLTTNQIKNICNALSYLGVGADKTKFYLADDETVEEVTRTRDKTPESYYQKLYLFLNHKNVPAVVIVDNSFDIWVIGKDYKNSFKLLKVDTATPFPVRHVKSVREGPRGFTDIKPTPFRIGSILEDIRYLWQLSDDRDKLDFDYSRLLNDVSGKYLERKGKYKGLKPTTKEELKKLVADRISQLGFDCNLNNIDVSGITDMSGLFMNTRFNGDISKWDVSNVKDMSDMFANSRFTGNITKWDVSNVKDMSGMFSRSKFNGNLSKWSTLSLENASGMFMKSEFNGDISDWDTRNLRVIDFMFADSRFDGDISKWDDRCIRTGVDTFRGSPLEGNEPRWYLRNRIKK